jgi:hypothetical protein
VRVQYLLTPRPWSLPCSATPDDSPAFSCLPSPQRSAS